MSEQLPVSTGLAADLHRTGLAADLHRYLQESRESVLACLDGLTE